MLRSGVTSLFDVLEAGKMSYSTLKHNLIPWLAGLEMSFLQTFVLATMMMRRWSPLMHSPKNESSKRSVWRGNKDLSYYNKIKAFFSKFMKVFPGMANPCVVFLQASTAAGSAKLEEGEQLTESDWKLSYHVDHLNHRISIGWSYDQDGVDGQSVFGDLKSECSASSRRSRCGGYLWITYFPNVDISLTGEKDEKMSRKIGWEAKAIRVRKWIPNDPNINGWSDMQRPSTSFACLEVNGSLMVWHGMTKDNSTNAEEQPAVDHEVKEFAEVWNVLMFWIFTFDASHVRPESRAACGFQLRNSSREICQRGGTGAKSKVPCHTFWGFCPEDHWEGPVH